MAAYQIQGLSFTYPGQSRKALDSINLTIQQGDFVVLCGPSGCGKSTLLRQLKTVLTPCGQRAGTVLFEGRLLDELDQRTQSQQIGFVLQSPENQIVTDKVWHELAFGLESLGVDTPTIRRRVAEMASFFGIQNWFHKDVQELSGGQKQLLNLAAVMVMQPHVLILDEPTSQLDPIAASEFLTILGRINRELGTTILLTEHHLEEVFALASQVAVLEQGRLLCTGTPREVGAQLKLRQNGMFQALPVAMRVWAAVGNNADCPVTVRDGRNWLADYAASHELQPLEPEQQCSCDGTVILAAQQVWFRYERDLPPVVKGLTMSVRQGEFLALLGGNGIGKTTSLKLLSGLLKPERGRVQVKGRIGLLPQNPQTLFLKKTVQEDLWELFEGSPMAQTGQTAQINRVVQLCCLQDLLLRHPYDLSGGEQQRVALAKLLLLQPDILLLDEPTKSLDAEFKQSLGQLLQALVQQGVTVVIVSHDIEFCARYAQRCALFFDGAIVAEGTPRSFFSGNSFYTTAANRMARDVLPEAITADEIIAACGGAKQNDTQEIAMLPPRDPLLRKQSLREPEQTEQTAPLVTATGSADRQALSSRTKLSMALVLLLIPLTLLLGQYYFSGRKYYLTSLFILLECMLPFFLMFEGRKPQARELVIIAVLCAIGVAGRALLFMLPQFKPVLALTIIAGVAFGGETGFLVGAMTMLVSNILFSQGPWTPWQMFSTGIIGFFAGILFRSGRLPRSRAVLCGFGFFTAIFIYGGIMNPASALLWTTELNWKIIAVYYISGFPMDVVHGAATAFFLWVAALPMLEKLERVKVKYGLVKQKE